MQISQVCTILASCLLMTCLTTTALPFPTPDMGDFPQQYDSYAVIPNLNENSGDTELNLQLVPPTADLESTGPRIYYMNSDGLAEAVSEQRRFTRKREALPVAADETMLADETVIIGPPSGNRPFGQPAVNLGFRPARAYYARRYHKYPWNYH